MSQTFSIRRSYGVKGHWRHCKNGKFWVEDHTRVDRSMATKKRIAKAMLGKNNPAYVDGRRSYRRIAGARPGQLVHHKDENRHHNEPSNLKIIPRAERWKHDVIHHREENFGTRHSWFKTESPEKVEAKMKILQDRISNKIDEPTYQSKLKEVEETYK